MSLGLVVCVPAMAPKKLHQLPSAARPEAALPKTCVVGFKMVQDGSRYFKMVQGCSRLLHILSVPSDPRVISGDLRGRVGMNGVYGCILDYTGVIWGRMW